MDDSFTNLDLTLHYQRTQQSRWNLSIGIRNALNAHARNLSVDLGQIERNYFAELRYHLD